jgi:hypothetical protein
VLSDYTLWTGWAASPPCALAIVGIARKARAVATIDNLIAVGERATTPSANTRTIRNM